MHRVCLTGKHKTGSLRVEPKPYRKLSVIFLGLIFTAFLAGCANSFRWSTPDPTIVELRLSATNLLNPNSRGRASPLLVRLYELNDIDVFANVDFFTLMDNDIAVLGKDLEKRQELDIKPGENAEVRFEAMPGTRFLAVFAAYRKLDSAKWRDWVAVPLNTTSPIELRFDSMEAGFTIEVE